jgi:hypothetical protein
MILKTVISMTDKVTFYRHVEPAAPYPQASLKAFGEEYRTFQILRNNDEYLLYSIHTNEGGIPPLALRGHFTTKDKAKIAIDEFFLKQGLPVKQES